MKKTNRISHKMEDYLEGIALLKKRRGAARVCDIARLLNVKKPSVTAAVKVLTRDGLAIHERYGYIELTAAGRRIASEVQEKHDTLIQFLTRILSIDRRTAEKDACKMEHAMSPKTMAQLTKFMALVEKGSLYERIQKSRRT